MELFKGLGELVFKVRKSIDTMTESTAPTVQERAQAAQVVSKVATKAEALKHISGAVSGIYTDPNPERGYFKALKEGLVLKARNFGASEKEISDAIGLGIEGGLMGTRLINQGDQHIL